MDLLPLGLQERHNRERLNVEGGVNKAIPGMLKNVPLGLNDDLGKVQLVADPRADVAEAIAVGIGKLTKGFVAASFDIQGLFPAADVGMDQAASQGLELRLGLGIFPAILRRKYGTTGSRLYSLQAIGHGGTVPPVIAGYYPAIAEPHIKHY